MSSNEPVIFQIHYFDRTSGHKKCKLPFKSEPLPVSDVEKLEKNFCKKNPQTGVQKQFKCLPCNCRIEASVALKQHLKGEKHLKSVETYIPKELKIGSLEYLIGKHDSWVLGLANVEEYSLTPSEKSGCGNQTDKKESLKTELEKSEDEDVSPIYKCVQPECNGAFGPPEDFFKHLISGAHCDNFLKELGFVGRYIDQDTRMKHSSKDFSAIIKIKETERYWIQHNLFYQQQEQPESTSQQKQDACSQLLAAGANSSSTSSSIHCSTPEATSGLAISGNGNNACSTTLVNSTSGLPVTSAAVVAGTASAAHAAHAAAAAQAAAVSTLAAATKRKLLDDTEIKSDVKKAKLETKALKAKRPGFTDERYNETSYYYDANTNLRKVYPYYFTFTTFTKGRWVGERILDVFAREFRAHPAEEYERCIKAGTLTVNYEKVDIDYRLKHNDLLANIVHRHEVPVSSEEIKIVHIDDDLVVVNKPASIPVHPCGRYRHNTVVFILAKEHGLKNLRTIHRLDRLTSGLLLFGRNPKKAREMEQQIRTRQVQKEYVCRVDGEFPTAAITCKEPIEVVSYKIGVCKVSSNGKDCHTDFQRLGYNGRTSVVLCKPRTGRMHQIRVHLQYLGFPVVNDPLYNHIVFGPEKGKGGRIGKSDEQLIQDLISIHNAENWLGMDDDLGGPMSTSNVQPSTASPPQNKALVLAGNSNLEKTIQANLSNKLRSGTPDSAIVTDFNHHRMRSVDSPSSSSPTSTASNASINGDHVWSGVQLDNVGASCKPASKMASVASEDKVTIATQTGIEEADKGFDVSKLSIDPHCYECKVKYRDPRPKDLVMFLHAWAYSGPDWQYRTELPAWAKENWIDPEDYS